jgi:alpha-galactosidase
MITNKNFSINLQNDLAFEISGRNLLLAKGDVALSGEEAKGNIQSAREESISTTLGKGKRFAFSAQRGEVNVTVEIDSYDSLDDCVVMRWTFKNAGSNPVELSSISAPALELNSNWAQNLWTMQGVSVTWGQDFAFKLPEEFECENYLGHLQNGEGGGIPILYFWNQSGGLSLAHIEPTQELWYMPVTTTKSGTRIKFEDRRKRALNPGQIFQAPRVMLSFHQGDFFEPLKLYREVMARQGLKSPEFNREDFAPAWCSWGYEFDVKPSEVIGVLPKLKEMGIHWLTLDDRWFDRYGDWNPRADTFPNGVRDIKEMNEKIHEAGAFSQIWWYPLCVEDGVGGWDAQTYGTSKTLRSYNHWLVLNEDGSAARNNRGLAMICPGLPKVRDYTAALTRKFIEKWGFDGHKLDNIYTMPPCHNPAHNHADPEESVRGFAEVYRQIFEITRQLKPYSVTQICPCGSTLTHTLIPATDQTVTADPTSSVQIRQRIKFYKGLMGERAAVFADHVELSDGGIDFASCFGTGGVLATKFTHPLDEALKARLKEDWSLAADKEALWKKWFDLSSQHSLASGEYLNLYDMAFDFPEAHAIRKDDSIYYAFFAEEYSGQIHLRGLDESKKYRIIDYVEERTLGEVPGTKPYLEVKLRGALLIKVTEV